jgi:FMN phosphatase YigB (HAD superfamily)
VELQPVMDAGSGGQVQVLLLLLAGLFGVDAGVGEAGPGFEDLVDEIIYSHECGMSKPDPEIYALTCERLQVEPAQTVFLDDSEPCVEGARQAGIHAVLFQDNSQAIGDIENLLAL